MAAQKGRDILLKIGNGAQAEQFETVAGLRSRTIALRAGSVDTTDSGSPESWRELLAGTATKSATISGTGVFRDAPSDARVRSAFFEQSAPNWQIIVPDFARLTGRFVVTSLDYVGEHDTEARFTISLASAGVLAFEAI